MTIFGQGVRMPSLSPGTPGAKEVYGICLVKENLMISIPPKACARYKIERNDEALLITGHKQESGFGFLKRETAVTTVFNKYLTRLNKNNMIGWERERAYVLIEIINNSIVMTPEIMAAFYLKKYDPLLAIKSTTVSIGFVPVAIWKNKLAQRGFMDAIRNIDLLDVF
jgi:hypothetical protein